MSALISLIIVVLCASLFAACNGGLANAGKVRFAEWHDEDYKISFRIANNTCGYGYITIGGEKVAATYQFVGWKGQLSITLDEDLNTDDDLPITSDGFGIRDVNGNGQIVSTENNVELFGEYYGKVVLSYTQLEKSDFECWEFISQWEDDGGLLSFHNNCTDYYVCKSAGGQAKCGDRFEQIVFKWIPDGKKFEIYEHVYVDDEHDSFKGETLAEGTYVDNSDVAVLTFTKNNLFTLDTPTLTIRTNN